MENIYTIINASVIPFWILLAFFSKSKATEKFVFSYYIHYLLAIFYLLFIAWGMFQNFGGNGGMDSLASLRIAFENDQVLLAAWAHYLVFDLFVGTWIAKTCLNENISSWIKISSLIFTLAFGPVGLLLFAVLRRIPKASKKE